MPRHPLASAPVSGPLATIARAESAHATPRPRLELQLARLSADRTLLAVVVTALALIASGFVIFQLFQGLRSARVWDGGATATRNFGVTLVCLGELLLLLGSVHTCGCCESYTKRSTPPGSPRLGHPTPPVRAQLAPQPR